MLANFVWLIYVPPYIPISSTQPVGIIFTVVICAAELGHVGRRTAHVCHVNPAFDACFHVRRGAQRKATATVVPPSCDLLTTFCTYEEKKKKAQQQQDGAQTECEVWRSLTTVCQQVKKEPMETFCGSKIKAAHCTVCGRRLTSWESDVSFVSIRVINRKDSYCMLTENFWQLLKKMNSRF